MLIGAGVFLFIRAGHETPLFGAGLRNLQFTALSGCVQFSGNRVNEMATLLLLPCIGSRVSLQICVKFLPLMGGNPYGRHSTIVANVTEQYKCKQT